MGNDGAAPTCADIDECATNNGGCGDAKFWSCTNNDCAAPTCADIDECATNNGGCGDATFYSCTNNVGAAPTCACTNNDGGVHREVCIQKGPRKRTPWGYEDGGDIVGPQLARCVSRARGLGGLVRQRFADQIPEEPHLGRNFRPPGSSRRGVSRTNGSGMRRCLDKGLLGIRRHSQQFCVAPQSLK